MSNLAEISILSGDFVRARALATEALKLAHALGDRRHTAYAHSTLGWIALADAELDDAADHFALGLTIMRDLGYKQFSISFLFGLAGVAAASDDADRASQLQAAATKLEAAYGHQPTAADARIHLRYLDPLRDASDSDAWVEFAHRGSGMEWEEAIRYALA